MEHLGHIKGFNNSNQQIENILTHEVFKHGLLMSQQVINNGLPSNKANMKGQHKELDTTEAFVEKRAVLCKNVFVLISVECELGSVHLVLIVLLIVAW